jgi:hypothetical protein
MIIHGVKRFSRPATIALILTALIGCEGADVEYNYPTSGPGGRPTYEKQESIFGEGGLTLFENQGAQSEGGGEGGGIGVNSFLWRASLDTVSFMPLQSAISSFSTGRCGPTGSAPRCSSNAAAPMADGWTRAPMINWTDS